MNRMRSNLPIFFAGSSLYGITDGQQIANWGGEFPIFARIENGAMYAVGIEKGTTVNASGQRVNKPDFDTVYKLNRAFMRNPFPNDADLFQDVTHQQVDNKYPASDYNWSNKDQNFRATFNRSAGPAVTPSPSGGSTTTTTSSKSTLKTVGIIAGILVVIGLIVAAVYVAKKRR